VSELRKTWWKFVW